MSIEAISRALRSTIPGSANKFVLVALANYADEKLFSYPSCDRLCLDTSLDRKTVLRALSWLRTNKVITDTGHRKGSTNGVIVYQLAGIEKDIYAFKAVPKTEPLSSPKNGTCSDSGTVPFLPEAVPNFPAKQSQISTEAVPFLRRSSPKNGIQNLKGTVSEPSVNLTVNEPVAKPPKKKAVRAAPKPGGIETWEAYSRAYQDRYGVPPSSNAMVRGQIARFCERVPTIEAPLIAAFYVFHNASFYVVKMHPVGLLLSDAEKLRTEWATNRKVTSLQARQSDRTEGMGQVWNDLIEKEDAKNGQRTA